MKRSHILHRFGWVIASWIFLGLAYPSLHDWFGDIAESFFCLPVLLTGWFLGLAPGIIGGAIILPLLVLYSYLGYAPIDIPLSAKLPGIFLIIGLGGAAGWIRNLVRSLQDQKQALQEQVVLRRTAEDALRQANIELDRHVRERTAELEQANRNLHQQIEERQKAEQALRESDKHFRQMTENIDDVIWLFDLRQQRMVYLSPSFKKIAGECSQSEMNSPEIWLKSVHPLDRERVQLAVQKQARGEQQYNEIYRVVTPEGKLRWNWLRSYEVRDQNGQVTCITGIVKDITEHKELEERLRHEALHDTLTGLPNRTFFTEQVRHSLERSRRHPEYLAAVVFLDLDRFKIVNDSLGHSCGDDLLISVAHSLEGCVREEDTVSRLSGDEFAVLLDDLQRESGATQVADRILRTLSSPFNLNGQEVFTSASIGIVMVSPEYIGPEDVVRDADTAMYRAKARGGNCTVVFDEAMHQRTMTLLHLENDLRRAVERQEFEVYYQPILSLESQQVNGMEALVRWHHPTRGLLLPAEFIPLAEDTGLILPIGKWVLQTACVQAQEWQQAGYGPLKLSVNVSARQLQGNHLVDEVRQALASSGLESQMLDLEITESAAMQDIEQTIFILQQLRSLGVQVSIDDFGSHYSALGYLKQFPATTIKMGCSFIKQITEQFHDAAIVSAIIAMGHILDLKVVAEGVETREQLDFLMPQRCDQIQGFLISPAVPAGEFRNLLENRPIAVLDRPANSGKTAVLHHP